MENAIYQAALDKAEDQVRKKGLTGQEAPDFAEVKVWKPYMLAFRFWKKAKKKVLGRIGK